MSPKSSKNKTLKTSRGYKERKVNYRDKRERFLIVCEGSKTEPHYFKCFRVPGDVVEIDIRGIGENTINLVKEAIKIQEKEDKNYDQVWCVFDKDSFSEKQFNQALDIAKKNNIKVAYSNEAFEIWYILHFGYRDTAMSRQEYQIELTKKLRKEKLIKKNQKYDKNDNNMYDYLQYLQPQAIKNAEQLLQQYYPPQPALNNPSTTVHLLVKELNKFARP